MKKAQGEKHGRKNERKGLSRLDILYITYVLYFTFNVTVEQTENT